MSIAFNPYLSFDGNAKDVMEFYHSVFGGDLDTSKYTEMSGMPVPPGWEEKLMHAELKSPDVHLMGADNMPSDEPYVRGGFGLSLSGDDEVKLRGYWDKLVEGGRVTMPMEKAPWGDTFGMLYDKYEMHWMVNVLGQKE